MVVQTEIGWVLVRRDDGGHGDGRSRRLGRGRGLVRVLVPAAGSAAAPNLRASHSLHRLRGFPFLERALRGKGIVEKGDYYSPVAKSV